MTVLVVDRGPCSSCGTTWEQCKATMSHCCATCVERYGSTHDRDD